MRSSERVHIACLAQLVNVIAPITTNRDGFFRQTIYYPYLWALKYGIGDVLDLAVWTDSYSVRGRDRVPYIDAAGTIDRRTGVVSLFILNRDLEKYREVDIVWREIQPKSVIFSQVLTGPDLKAFNSFENPAKVSPQAFEAPRLATRTTLKLPPRSYTILRIDT